MMRIVKDKNKPKGPMSAYACFVQVIREEHKKKHPEESVVFSEFSKKCAEKWKTMTDKEKQRFDDMASRDKERYIREMDAYVPPDGVKKPRKRRRNKDPAQPKRALSAFFFFCEEKRPAVRTVHPDWKVGDIAKELGRQWEMCQCKGKYESQAIADKSRYEREMLEYKNGTFTITKRARLEDVISGETSGMTAAGNGYQMRPDNMKPAHVYSPPGMAAVPEQTPLQPATHIKAEMPAYDAQPKPEMPDYETQVKQEIHGAGPSYGNPAPTADAISHPPAYTHQNFTQVPAQQPPQPAMSQESPAVPLQAQAYGGVIAQDLSAPPQPQPQPQLQQPQLPSAPPQQVPQPTVSHDISNMQQHATPGGDTVDLSAERNGGSAEGMGGVTHGSNEEVRSAGNGEDEEEDDDDEELDDEGGDE